MTYSQLEETKRLLSLLINDKSLNLPEEVKNYSKNISYYNNPEKIIIPCPLKQCEVGSALKGLEASVALALANFRYNITDNVKIDMVHALFELMLTYLSSVDGMTKQDKNVILKLKPTDLNKAQSILYRRMSANLYRTKDQRYYHIHGSLDASTTLNMIGLPAYAPELTEYDDVVKTIQDAVSKFECNQLEKINLMNRQAGVEALKYEDFLQTDHGKVINNKPLFEVEEIESETPPVQFSPAKTNSLKILEGVKVLELCRIIAGPTIGRTLATYGATVIKVTSPSLPDVPFFQVDTNMGKHTTDLNLKDERDRKVFEELLMDADVIIDGYRTNAIEKLGYGPSKIEELAKKRGKGYIYASENCFGFHGNWSERAGWQQIADCVSGVAWAQGEGLKLEEPVVPPFPISDYGTGCIVTIAVLIGLYKRAKLGGSYWCRSSLLQYDLFLLGQGKYPDFLWDNLLKTLNPDLSKLRYYDSVDRISKTALNSMKELNKDLDLVEDPTKDLKYFVKMYSEGFNGVVRVLKPCLEFDKTEVGFGNVSRPNGYDEPKWF